MANQGVVEVVGLPEAPIDAAAQFHAACVPQVRDIMAIGDVVVVFEQAGFMHRAWRLAAIQELAREAAPMRVNGIEGDDTPDVSETLAILCNPRPA